MNKKTKEYKKHLDMLGWVGFVLIIIAFVLVSFGFIEGRTYLYQILNLAGGLALGFVSYRRKDYQPALLNAAFAIVAVVSILALWLM